MKILPIIFTSYLSIIGNKVRSILTVLGIVIGISAVIALLSIGEGAQGEILSQVEGLGSNTVSVIPVAEFSAPTPGQSSSRALAPKIDRHFVSRLENQVKYREIEIIATIIIQAFEVTYEDKVDIFTVYGADRAYFDLFSVTPIAGSQFSESDIAKQRKIAFIGSGVSEDLFGKGMEEEAIGKKIKIDGSNYRIVGVMEPKNEEFDQQLVVPQTTAANILMGRKDFDRMAVKVTDENLIDSVATKIEDELLDYYRVTDAEKLPFAVVSSKEIIEVVGTITGVFTTLIASIAGISLLVGGIGIMNIMLVSVTERTKEIGLRKAVGAKERAILFQFLTESLMLTILGGIIGVIFGFIFAFIISRLGNIPAVFTLDAILLATSVSSIIGIVFGFYPAYRAAKLNPIDALRYE